MMILGHKTASVYKRYRIVPENDIREALQKVEKGHRAAKEKPARAFHDWKVNTMNPITKSAQIPAQFALFQCKGRFGSTFASTPCRRRYRI
jgi:hypothetical protein